MYRKQNRLKTMTFEVNGSWVFFFIFYFYFISNASAYDVSMRNNSFKIESVTMLFVVMWLQGCISVSLSFYQTSFCFICSHLASGEKEGDELRRNLDVIEILKNTQFPRICKTPYSRMPDKILDHEWASLIETFFFWRVTMQRFLNFLIIFLSNFSYIWSQNFWLYMGNFFSSRIIWFGDLNYRISLSRDDAKRLVEMKDWPALFNKDQVLSLC